MFDTLFVKPFVFLLDFFADAFQGSYGISIILVTLVVRICLLPLFCKQQKAQKYTQAKMLKLKPDLDILQQKLREAKTKEQQHDIQQQMASLYREHQVNPLAIGCLPMLVQFPILIGLYYAISRSTEISSHSFLWFDLGSSNVPMALIAGLIYVVQFIVSLKLSNSMTHQNPRGNPSLNMIGLLSPVMMVVFSLNMPAALPLYWAIGGLFMIGQTVVFQRFLKSKDDQTNKVMANQT